MARPRKDAAPTAENDNTGLIPWEEELAKAAVAASAQQAPVGGDNQRFSLKSGILSWQKQPLPNNEMLVYVLASLFDNHYYEGAFDQDNPAPPKCFALGADFTKLAPHPVAEATKQCDTCATCPHAKWGTAVKQDGTPSKGKACKHTQRLAVISAGTIGKDGRIELDSPQDVREAELGFIHLPVTSGAAWNGYVKVLAAQTNRPPFGVVTRIKVAPDLKTQFTVNFTNEGLVKAEYAKVLLDRVKEATELIQYPYAAWTPPVEAPAKRGNLPATRAAKSKF